MKIYIKTYGCQMNERDSEAAAAMLVSAGHTIVLSETDADLIILNTCSVRDQAERKAIGKLEILKRLKAEKSHLAFGIMGCMAQSRGEELLKKIPHLDFAVGTDRINSLPRIVAELPQRKALLAHDEIRDAEGLDSHTVTSFKAYISIMRGCNRFCTYCIVPYVRGRERSRSAESIVREARALAQSGVREIMLLGQNVAAYGTDSIKMPDGVSPFADLLEEICAIDGIERVRFTSPHPAFFNRRLIECIAKNDKICKSIHLPMQSGSDRILKAMNRPYTADEYMRIVDSLKSMCGEDNIAFSTDVIVGFPGETEEDFNMTRELMNKVGFDIAYIFKYSPRKGTKASLIPDNVPTEIKEQRNQILLADLEKVSEKKNSHFLGKTVDVLAEGPSKRNQKRWSGRSDMNKLVVFRHEDGMKPGDLVKVKIARVTPVTLFGERLPD